MNGSVLTCEEKLFGESLPPIILFVCTGNTCRSPMAAALFNHLYPHRGIAVSAGLGADGSPISANAVYALDKRGVPSEGTNDYRRHVSRTVTEAMVESADRVIGISAHHGMILMSAFPEHAEKVGAMPRDIADPFGGSPEDYVRCLGDIESALRELFGCDEDQDN